MLKASSAPEKEIQLHVGQISDALEMDLNDDKKMSLEDLIEKIEDTIKNVYENIPVHQVEDVFFNDSSQHPELSL
jgi:hypothetical protein